MRRCRWRLRRETGSLRAEYGTTLRTRSELRLGDHQKSSKIRKASPTLGHRAQLRLAGQAAQTHTRSREKPTSSRSLCLHRLHRHHDPAPHCFTTSQTFCRIDSESRDGKPLSWFTIAGRTSSSSRRKLKSSAARRPSPPLAWTNRKPFASAGMNSPNRTSPAPTARLSLPHGQVDRLRRSKQTYLPAPHEVLIVLSPYVWILPNS